MLQKNSLNVCKGGALCNEMDVDGITERSKTVDVPGEGYEHLMMAVVVMMLMMMLLLMLMLLLLLLLLLPTIACIAKRVTCICGKSPNAAALHRSSMPKPRRTCIGDYKTESQLQSVTTTSGMQYSGWPLVVEKSTAACKSKAKQSQRRRATSANKIRRSNCLFSQDRVESITTCNTAQMLWFLCSKYFAFDRDLKTEECRGGSRGSRQDVRRLLHAVLYAVVQGRRQITLHSCDNCSGSGKKSIHHGTNHLIIFT
jgi:hypothetical protein